MTEASMSQEATDRWVAAFLASLRQHLWSSTPQWNSRDEDLEVESVDLAGGYPDGKVVIVFCDHRRPGCRFGYRWGPLWHDDPEFMATVAWTNFDEARALRLPQECEANQITWLDEPSGNDQPA